MTCTDDQSEGVSPVLAVILLVAVTVILSTAVGMFVFEVAGGTSTTPQAGVTVGETGGGTAEVRLVDSGNTDEVIVRYADGSETALNVGESATVPDGEAVDVFGVRDGNRVLLDSIDSDDAEESVAADADLVAHYDATELSLSDGDSVDTWPDMSGIGNTATQSDSAKQPTYQATRIGGQPAVTFDGSDDWLRIPNDETLSVTDDRRHEIIIVMQTTTGDRGFLVGKRVDHGNWVPHYLVEINHNSDIRHSTRHPDGDTDHRTSGTVTDGSPHIITGIWNEDTNEIRLDGSRISTTDASATPAFDSTGDVDGAIGTHYRGDTTTGYYAGAIGEILVYDRVLSDEERSEIESHLAEKWGV